MLSVRRIPSDLSSVICGSVILTSLNRHKAGPYTFSAIRLLLSDTPTTDYRSHSHFLTF